MRGGAAALLLFAAGCQAHYATLDRASPEATRITVLHWLIFWVTGAVGTIVFALVCLGILKRRGLKTADGERQRERSVAAATVVSVLILVFLLVESVLAGRAVVTPVGKEALEIEIVGHQWWWEVRYPAIPESDTVTTANEIHVPVGRPVRLLLSTADVIHSFWAPNLHGKKDLIPGHPTTHLFRAERAGTFPGQCAEFCGYQHAHMGLLVVAEDPSRFQAWLAKERTTAAEPPDEATRHGREVFLSSACVLCHSIRGAGAFGHKAPDLTHLAGRSTIAAATLPNAPGHLAGWIADSQRIKPGNRMPPNPLEAADLLDLVAYLRSLK